MLEQIDAVRTAVGAQTDRKHKAKLGQFMTPLPVARFMASMFLPTTVPAIRLLDAGAGIGSLTAAYLDRLQEEHAAVRQIEVTAYEIDIQVRQHLLKTLSHYAETFPLTSQVIADDFIEDAVNALQFGTGPRFTHAILNPPYKKISSQSRHRLLLRQAGIETVNLYSAFLALAVALLESGGQMVAIVPRSFCNGPYYRPFRDFILDRAAIRHLHLFASRNQAFKDDKVLQENIILLIEKDGIQGEVALSTSSDDGFADYLVRTLPFEQIVLSGDEERFIHIPLVVQEPGKQRSAAFHYSLADLGVEVSTGPVVDFRMKEHLREYPTADSVPLLYPCHITDQQIQWPKADGKKPNALALNGATQKWLYPSGFYAVVKRFSSKEERRRIVAGLVNPQIFDTQFLGFENHLNVFHQGKNGLPEDLAYGLVTYLNSSAVDAWFRCFSGHTQVNVADLKKMKFPSAAILKKLGRWAKTTPCAAQEQIDLRIEELV